jgi:hypothetical protein
MVFFLKGGETMISRKPLLKFIPLITALCLLMSFGYGCSTAKEAVATPPKPAPVASPAPAVDTQKLNGLMKRAESAASLAEAAAKKADLAAQKAELSSVKAEKAASRAEAAANKVEAIFKKKLKK